MGVLRHFEAPLGQCMSVMHKGAACAYTMLCSDIPQGLCCERGNKNRLIVAVKSDVGLLASRGT